MMIYDEPSDNKNFFLEVAKFKLNVSTSKKKLDKETAKRYQGHFIFKGDSSRHKLSYSGSLRIMNYI